MIVVCDGFNIAGAAEAVPQPRPPQSKFKWGSVLPADAQSYRDYVQRLQAAAKGCEAKATAPATCAQARCAQRPPTAAAGLGTQRTHHYLDVALFQSRPRARPTFLGAPFSWVDVLVLPSHHGFAGAVQAAVRKVSTEFVLVVQHDWLFQGAGFDVAAAMRAMSADTRLKYVAAQSLATGQVAPC